MLRSEVAAASLDAESAGRGGESDLELVIGAVGFEVLGRKSQHVNVLRGIGYALKPGLQVVVVVEERSACAVRQLAQDIRLQVGVGALIFMHQGFRLNVVGDPARVGQTVVV